MVGFDEEISGKDLRSLHGIKPGAINATADKTVFVPALERVRDWLRQGRGTVNSAVRKHAPDLPGGDEGTRAIVHCHIARSRSKQVQSGSDRILSMVAT